MATAARTLSGVISLSAGLLATVLPGSAEAAFSSYATRTTRANVHQCVNRAAEALGKAGFTGVDKSTEWVRGHTPKVFVYVVCVRLPKAGACGGDGSTAVIVGVGEDENETTTMKDKVRDRFNSESPSCM